MSIEIVRHWPFFEFAPTEAEVQRDAALKRFEKAERRALGSPERDTLSDIESNIGQIRERAREIDTKAP